MRRKLISWGIVLSLALSVIRAVAAPQPNDGWVDSGRFKRFHDAVRAAVHKTLLIARPQSVDSDITIPAHTHLLFVEGGAIKRAPTHRATVTIKGSITAPSSQIFIGFKPGEIVLGESQVDQVYPQWWGAKGDGIADDSQAIQAGIDSDAPVVHIPRGRYLLNSPINLTNHTSLILKGQGIGDPWKPLAHYGTILIGNTGGIVIDVTGSRYLVFQDFRIIAGEKNPSTVGILYARSTKCEYCEFNSLSNVAVHLRSIPGANNGNGTVAIYNRAAELWRAWNIWLIADNAVVFTAGNIFKTESPFTKHSGIISMSECTIGGASALHALNGHCILVDTGWDIEVTNTYLAGKGPERCPYAIRMTGWQPTAFTYTGHVEFGGGLLYSDATLVDVKLRATMCALRSLICLDGTGEGVPGIRGGEITVIPTHGSKPHHLIEAVGKQNGIVNATANLYPDQSVSAAGGSCTGNIVRAEHENPSVAFSASPGWFSYMVMARDGVTIYGPLSTAAWGHDLKIAGRRILHSPHPPTSGSFAVGDIVYNTSPSPGGYVGWVCVTPGTAAPNWSPSTAYATGDMLAANSRVYRCVVAGKSGTVAPSHTEGKAVDGTVTWEYVGPAPIFKPFGKVGD